MQATEDGRRRDLDRPNLISRVEQAWSEAGACSTAAPLPTVRIRMKRTPRPDGSSGARSPSPQFLAGVEPVSSSTRSGRDPRFNPTVAYRLAETLLLACQGGRAQFPSRGQRRAWADHGFDPAWIHFVHRATARQLQLFGFPPPGHPFWTPEALTAMAQRYPGLDLAPWRASG